MVAQGFVHVAFVEPGEVARTVGTVGMIIINLSYSNPDTETIGFAYACCFFHRELFK